MAAMAVQVFLGHTSAHLVAEAAKVGSLQQYLWAVVAVDSKAQAQEDLQAAQAAPLAALTAVRAQQEAAAQTQVVAQVAQGVQVQQREAPVGLG